MEQENEVKVRTKFIAWLSLILLLPFCLYFFGLLYTEEYQVALSLLLFILPFAYIPLRCFKTHQKEFLGLITLTEARIIYVLCLILVVCLGLAWGWWYSLGPILPAIYFFTFEPVLQYLPF